MDIKKYILVLPVAAALLFTASCNNDLEIVEEPQSEQVKIIPYTVSVGSTVATRVTLNEGCYVFEAGDKLYVWGDKISGELNLTSTGDNGYTASFSGYLTWTGEGEKPADDYRLNAVIVSSGNKIYGTLAEFLAGGNEPNYKKEAVFASSLKDAVQKFGFFEASSTYGDKAFNFYGRQYSAYVCFSITLADGSAEGSEIAVSISNDGSVERTGTVTTVKDGESVKVNFFTAFPTYFYSTMTQDFDYLGYSLDDASVKLGDRDAISFGAYTTLWGDMVYNITRYNVTASGSIHITSPSETDVPFSVKKIIKEETTLGEILNDKFKTITSFEKTSGSSIVFGSFDSEHWEDTSVTVNSFGETVIKVSGTASYGGIDIPVSDVIVTLKVE